MSLSSVPLIDLIRVIKYKIQEKKKQIIGLKVERTRGCLQKCGFRLLSIVKRHESWPYSYCFHSLPPFPLLSIQPTYTYTYIYTYVPFHAHPTFGRLEYTIFNLYIIKFIFILEKRVGFWQSNFRIIIVIIIIRMSRIPFKLLFQFKKQLNHSTVGLGCEKFQLTELKDERY